MKNFSADGTNIAVTAPAAVKSGDFLMIGYLYGWCQGDAASGAEVVLHTEGIGDVVKTAGTAWAVGDLIYWTGTAATKVVSTNTLIGVCTKAALSGAVVGRVKLNEAATLHA